MTQHHYEFLKVRYASGIVLVSLSRGPVNAVHQPMYREIEHFFRNVDSTGVDVRAVVLSGEGRHFCAGNDLEEFTTMTPANAPGRMRRVRAAFFAIQECPVPVIAAVHGSALGTGLAIAASADFVIAADNARFGVPEVSVGVMGGAAHLSRMIGQPMTRWAYFSAEPIPASEMHRLGGVVALAAPEELQDEALRRARQVARHGPTTLRFAKHALNEIEFMELQEAYRFEQSLTCEMAGLPEAREALAATTEARTPTYSAGVHYELD
ncbi:enoyl-CoA hydratase-related protein [Nocardioides sp. AE5]|uniref:enoyl-CoA hydratase-related protein n=1 Tax=Nocardioides sp. AE5 TaxID=2962573 RepID=UPI0028829CF2|nr:enoyl-CoA hydratase-related protein [Nocardioides sp. AE5]MDT0203195.1 enoyl-CoA hydratase-related protein [Nocardioides sp. AE5]